MEFLASKKRFMEELEISQLQKCYSEIEYIREENRYMRQKLTKALENIRAKTIKFRNHPRE